MKTYLIRAAAALLIAFTGPAHADTITDITGRAVTITGPVERIVLSDFRQIIGLSLIAPEAGARVVGAGSKQRVGPELTAALEARFPGLTKVPEVTDNSPTLSAEKTIALHPDLVILSEPPGPAVNHVVAQLERAGIPTVFVDFRIDAFDNTLPSLEIAAAALGVEDLSFLDFYRAHLNNVVQKAADLPEKPLVLMHLQATPETHCCMSLGEISLGRFIEAAGGRNLGVDIIPGAFAQISPEYILSHQPDIYIGTGGRQLERSHGLIVGPGVTEELARETLNALVKAPVLRDLDAVEAGRVYGLWHSIHNSPLNIVALEVMATWIHPEVFADLDPQATLAEINDRFLPFPFDGTIWVTAR